MALCIFLNLPHKKKYNTTFVYPFPQIRLYDNPSRIPGVGRFAHQKYAHRQKPTTKSPRPKAHQTQKPTAKSSPNLKPHGQKPTAKSPLPKAHHGCGLLAVGLWPWAYGRGLMAVGFWPWAYGGGVMAVGL